MIKKYEQYLKINGASYNTIVNYLSRIKDFLKDIEINEITEDIIIQYLLKLQETLSPSAVNGYKSAIKSFLQFLKKDVPLPKNIRLDRNKEPEHISEEFFETEIIPAVEEIFRNPLQVKAILYFMFYTGVRRSEIAQLKRDNINLEKRIAKIYGKGKKERLVVFTKKVKEILECYFTMEEEKKNAFNISSKAIGDKFDKLKPYFKEINLHAHILRHSTATHLRKMGISLEDIKEQLGHENIQTTLIYAHTDIKARKENYDKKVK